jgi:hypothetical protein
MYGEVEWSWMAASKAACDWLGSAADVPAIEMSEGTTRKLRNDGNLMMKASSVSLSYGSERCLQARVTANGQVRLGSQTEVPFLSCHVRLTP